MCCHKIELPCFNFQSDHYESSFGSEMEYLRMHNWMPAEYLNIHGVNAHVMRQ